MADRGRSERWVLDSLESARVAFLTTPPGPGDLTLEQYEERLRHLVERFLRSTRPYVGCTLDEAKRISDDSGDHLCVHRGPTGHRAYQSPNRVHVVLREDGTIARASRDRAPWD